MKRASPHLPTGFAAVLTHLPAHLPRPTCCANGEGRAGKVKKVVVFSRGGVNG